jgi:mannose-6-phosphate isomerase
MEILNKLPLYPLKFDPIYQYRLWGGRRLGELLRAPLPEGPVGEAWLLSDREDHPSLVSDGPLKGQSISQLMKQSKEDVLGKTLARFDRFPLLLKFLDVSKRLSVQVHPSDALTKYIPVGDSGKTESWVVLDAGPESLIYEGLKPGATPEKLRSEITDKTLADHLSSFRPKLGDATLVPAGTVHSLSNVVVFECQENSDVTFRLYDWDHVDPRTGKRRDLQIEEAIACIDFAQGEFGPLKPIVEEPAPLSRELLLTCSHFSIWRHQGNQAFIVGSENAPRVIVCLEGSGKLEHLGADYSFSKGDVTLLPASVGRCRCRTSGMINLLEIAIPDAG